MCYSLSLYSDMKALVRRFNASPAPSLSTDRGCYLSAFVFPKIPVITNREPALIHAFRWGLIPAWVSDAEKAHRIRSRTLNARFESLDRRPAFRQAIRDRRCLVLVDGFFEFREVGGKKYPYFIRMRDGEPFSLAGVWDTWTVPDGGRPEATFAVVTVPANPLLSKIHNTKKRMPLILTREMEETWLARPLTPEEVGEMKVRLDEKAMEAYPVSRKITGRGTEGTLPELPRRWAYPELQGHDL